MANDSSNNNTNELSAKGLTVGNFNDPTARMISSKIARENLNNSISDEKLNAFRETVYKMCYTWEKEELVRIISEYGDSSYLKSSNPSKKELARVCTESLIVHLSQSDLQQLISDINIKERKLKGAVKSAQRSRDKLAKSFFNANTIRDYGKVPAKTNKEKSDQKKNYRQALISTKVPRNIRSQFKKLRRELNEVLTECFNRFQLYSTAQAMGIETTARKDSEVIRDIIDKTILYVAVLTGSRATLDMAGAIGDPTPYNDLLLYTSYSYLTGKPGLDPSAWKALRENAKKAKIQTRILSRAARQRANNHSRAFLNMTNGQSRRKDIREHDTGVLSEMSDSEILEMAAAYQINVKKKKIGDVKYELYQKMAALSMHADKNAAILDRAKAKGIVPSENARLAGDIYGAFSIPGRLGSANVITDNFGSNGTPIVKFDNAGQLLTSAITVAVPVYVVNGTAGGANGEASAHAGAQKKAIAIAKNFETTTSYKYELNPVEKSTINQFRVADEAFLTKVYTALAMEARIPDSAIQTVKAYRAEDGSITDAERMHACQLYAMFNGMRNLAKYIEKYFNYPMPRVKQGVISSITGVAKNISGKLRAVRNEANALSDHGKFYKTISALRTVHRTTKSRKNSGKIGGVADKKRKTLHKFEDISDLPQSIQDYYYSEYNLAYKNIELYYNNVLKNPPYDYLYDANNTTDALGNKSEWRGFSSIVKLYRGDPENGIAADRRAAANKAVMLKAYVDGQRILVTLILDLYFNGDIKEGPEKYKRTKGIHGIGHAFKRLKTRAATSILSRTNFFNKDSAIRTNTSLASASGIAETAVPASKQYRNVEVKANGTLATPLDDDATLFATPVFLVGSLKNVNAGASILSGVALKKSNDSATGEDILKSMEAAKLEHKASKFSDPSKKGYNKHITRKRIIKDGSASSLADVSVDIPSMQNRPSALRVIDFSRDILAQANIAGGVDVSTYTVQPAIPTVLTKSQFNDITALARNITNSVEDVGETISSGFSTLYKGLASDVAVGPFIAGTITRPGFLVGSAIEGVKKLATTALVTANNITQLGITGTLMNSGGTVSPLSTPATVRKAPAITRFATGGTSAITGDAAGPNIFANGARPELVQSSGSMTVTPLNPAGSQTKQRISRMTTAERSKALSVGVSSHVVRLSYELPSGATDVSNPGEAIKVYDVKPGISDQISIGNGESTSLIAMISGIYSALTNILSTQAAGNQLLTVIGANTARSKNAANSSINQNQFAGGFPTELDGILEGE